MFLKDFSSKFHSFSRDGLHNLIVVGMHQLSDLSVAPFSPKLSMVEGSAVDWFPLPGLSSAPHPALLANGIQL